MSLEQNRSMKGKLLGLAALVLATGSCFLLGRTSAHWTSTTPVAPASNIKPPLQPASFLPNSQTSGGSPSATVRIDPEKQQLIGVAIVAAEKSGGSVQKHFSGTVAPEEPRIARVSVGVDGWVRSTQDGSIGSHVKKGEKLAEIWSPEFITAINSYLVATDRGSVAVRQASIGIDNANLRLRNLGMSDEQIAAIGETRHIPDEVDIGSPIDGFIISRNIAAGSRFEMGAEFYRIADLSRVWILADFTENEAQNFKAGTTATITLKQGQTIQARVSDALPQFNKATQTMRLRLEAANPGYELRPEMLVDVQLPVSLPQGVTVPAEAVIDSGSSKRVFVDRGNGYFEARDVQTGWRLGDRVQVTSGLREGERVIASGAFLVDSEARLKSMGGQ